MTGDPLTGQPTGERVRLRPLTLVDDGDDVVVGDPASGQFIAVPPVGAIVIRALQRGATLEECAEMARRDAGEPVDVVSFVETLRELGFVDDQPIAHPHEADASPPTPAATAPLQQRRWLTGVRPERARPLFSPAAWAVYAAALVFCAGCFVLRPELLPAPGDLFFLGDEGLSLVAVLPLAYLLAAVHEAWHWLAARSLGLPSRFGVDRRLYLLVFETDLTPLWSVPRRQRYGPQLAGLAVDVVVLAALLAVELLADAGWLALPAPAAGLVAALVFVKVAGILWQCLVFLRTDLYGVLVTATGCRNLWEVKSLLLRQAFGRLSAEQAAELAAADPRDVRVGRWFRWVYLAGFVAALAYFAGFYLPVMVRMLAWSAAGLQADPAEPRFWLVAAGSLLLFLPPLTVLGIWLTGRSRRAGT